MTTVGQRACGHAVHAALEGRDEDLERLERLFLGAPRGVAHDGTRWVLFAPELDACLGDAAGMHDAGTRIVRELNGVARILEARHQPVREIGRYEGPDGTPHIFAVARVELGTKATVFGSATGGTPAPPAGPLLLGSLGRDARLHEAAMLLAAAEQPDWVDLWKVFEVMREHAGGSVIDLVNLGWATTTELDSFKRSANDPAVSGSEARHARHKPATASAMTLVDARFLVSRMLSSWAASV